MAMRRSTQMLLIGVAVFVIGAGVVLVSLIGSGGDSGESSATTTSTLRQPGQVVVPSDGAPVPSTFTIPEGKQAVAVQVPYVAGLAGYAKAGDRVNIYATLEKGTGADGTPPPVAKLILPAVEVLAVTGPGAGAESGNQTYLLALDADQAEQAIFLARFESVWMTLVPEGQATPSTPGRSYQNAL